MLETICNVTPALGPDKICIEYPANERAIVWFVVIVEVVPAVAVSDAPIVVPVDHAPAVADAPADTDPANAGEGS